VTLLSQNAGSWVGILACLAAKKLHASSNTVLSHLPRVIINQLQTYQPLKCSTNMLKLELQFDNHEQASIVLNAQNYYNLLHDFYNALRSARKHGEGDGAVAKVVEDFWSELAHAIDHPQGAY
jgi:hypothetical protein